MIIGSFDKYTIRPIFEMSGNINDEMKIKGFNMLLTSEAIAYGGEVPRIFIDTNKKIKSMKFIGERPKISDEQIRDAIINLSTFTAIVGPYFLSHYEYEAIITWDKNTLENKDFEFKKREELEDY